MHANEVVPERDHVRVIFELFAERVCQPGEPAHCHPHREVRPLRGFVGSDLGREPVPDVLMVAM
jgi:hypothetical protein